MKVFGVLLLAAAVMLSSDTRGLRPRPAATDYSAQEAGRDVTVAASILSPEEVKSRLSTEMKEYLVLEVGVYPAAGQTIDLSPSDFALRAGERGEIVRAANPRAIATANQRKNTPPPPRSSDITLYPTATIGVASGTDPVTGRTNRGVYTGGGVGIETGGRGAGYPDPPRPGSSDRDREVMQQELADMMVPEGKTADPVAGYLYFPLPAKARTAALELQYFAASGKVRVLLPALPKGR